MFIDPPEYFAPIEEWEAFLASLKKIEKPGSDVIGEIAAAQAHIAEAEERAKQ